jgi:hypothetical protein
MEAYDWVLQALEWNRNEMFFAAGITLNKEQVRVVDNL